MIEHNYSRAIFSKRGILLSYYSIFYKNYILSNDLLLPCDLSLEEAL
jgi:hypothetical protein